MQQEVPFTLYRLDTGEITAFLVADPTISVPAGFGLLQGYWCAATHWVRGMPVELPSRPDDRHVWDPVAWEWVINPDLDTYQWAQLRMERTRLLAACDYRTQADYPQSDEARAAWRAYRQALRDLPEAIADPTKVEWPDPPAL
ncbi:tail fiber assembly protein [Ketogulonicigenium vulgare]|uniref:tail fiber assembly protein n=1 Tax=Ketogulonicigenium vulgare TaxID=92945 RepID=UPI0023588E2B|nr:tail fiber assembly protein [Ketogulonicigenium vulgare]